MKTAERQSSSAYRWALLRIADVTAIPADKRADLDFMRSAVSVARAYARGALDGKEPPTPPPLEGQLELTFEGDSQPTNS
jgi:hypothetical protein